MDDVRALLPMGDALRIQRDAFVSLASGNATVARNTWLRLPEPRRAWLKLLAGHDAPSSALGVKILARFPDNPSGANLGSLVILFDDDDGFPLAIMDGVYITAVRTGAGAGVATDVLAPEGATSIGIVGTGVVSWHSLAAIVTVRPSLTSVKVYSRSPERRARFVDRARSDLGVDARAVGSVEAAVAGVDVIVTGTNASTPILEDAHVPDGRLVNAMGIRTEIDPRLVARSLVVPDGTAESINEGKFSVALGEGLVSDADLGPQLGEILSGAAPAPSNDRVVMFDSSGVSIQDVASARHAWEAAERHGVGTLVDLGLARAP
jgi:ornithine cyclodeaminase/alanine dehydrogenase-like protein (mu-crystallin family)